jgi:hypothetical protein
MVIGSEKGAEVMIEPPGDARRRGILEIDDGILVARELRLIEERARSVNQAVVFVIRRRRDASGMKTHKE